MAKTTKKRINQLSASTNLGVFVSLGIGNPHLLQGNLYGYYSISISKNFRLIVKPIASDFDPKSLQQCETIMVKGIVDYHDGKQEWLIP